MGCDTFIFCCLSRTKHYRQFNLLTSALLDAKSYEECLLVKIGESG